MNLKQHVHDAIATGMAKRGIADPEGVSVVVETIWEAMYDQIGRTQEKLMDDLGHARTELTAERAKTERLQAQLRQALDERDIAQAKLAAAT
jgi:hypothetical protein